MLAAGTVYMVQVVAQRPGAIAHLQSDAHAGTHTYPIYGVQYLDYITNGRFPGQRCCDGYVERDELRWEL
jgi:hypothetical protein